MKQGLDTLNKKLTHMESVLESVRESAYLTGAFENPARACAVASVGVPLI